MNDTKPISSEQLAEFRALLDTMTEGDWEAQIIGSRGSDYDIFERNHGRSVATAGVGDAQAIATMRNNWAGLLDEIEELNRMMVYCNKCSSAPGEECADYCTRDGLRDF
jgi:hypothetical protein